jgi:hypothetical protein
MFTQLILITVFISFFLGSFLLQLSTKWIAKFKPRFITACKVMAISIAISIVISPIIKYLLSLAKLNIHSFLLNTALSLGIALIIQVIVSAKFLKHPETGSIGYANASKIVVSAHLVGDYIFAIVGLIFWIWMRHGRLG